MTRTGEMQRSQGREVKPQRENNPAGWELVNDCPAGFYSEGNMGLLEDIKPIAKANMEKSHARASGPLRDPVVEACRLCLRGFNSPGSRNAQNSMGCGLLLVSVMLSSQGPLPLSRGRPEQHPWPPLAPSLWL